MSYTRSRGGGSVTTPQRTQIRPGPSTPDHDSEAPKCTGHQRRTKRFVAGPSSKNPGRAFFTCPLSKDDPNRCKFFKWEDELNSTSASQYAAGGSNASRITAAGNAAQTLGQSPQATYGRPLGRPQPPPPAAVPAAASSSTVKASGAQGPDLDVDEDEGIDWEQVDTDGMEREAISSTPGSSQRETPVHAAGPPGFTERLRGAVEAGIKASGGKRKFDDGEDDEDHSVITVETTPKRFSRGEENPFLSTPGSVSSPPPHQSLTPTLSSLEHLSDHLHRQDRLIKAGEAAKEGFRRTIRGLQERNAELEKRVKELEKELGR